MGRLGDIFLRLVLDDADFEKDIVKKGEAAGAKAGQSIGSSIAAGIHQHAAAIGSALSTAGRHLTTTGRAMTTNVTLPILAAGAAVTKLGLDFDTTLRQIVGLTDVTADQIGDIREELIALGPEVGKSPQELAEAFYFVASAGFEAEEAMEVLRISAKAAATGLGETQAVAQVLGSVINAYGKENITAARAADILVEAISQGTAEAPEFAAVIGRVAPTAAALGVTFDQVAASLAAMTLTGLSAEESATSLNQVLVSLLKPTTDAEAALAGMGTSSAELRRQLREEGLLATLRELEERFGNNEQAAAAVFGNVRALRGVTALLGLDTEQLNTVFEKVDDSLGRLQQGYEETEGPQRDLDRAMADLNATALTLAQDVMPTVVDIVKQVAAGARDLAAWWRSLDDETRKNIVQWALWLAVAGPVLTLAGKLITVFAGLFKLVGFLAGAKGLPLLISKLGGAKVALAGFAIGLMGVTDAAANAELNKGLNGVREFATRFGREIGPFGRDADRFTDALYDMVPAGADVRQTLEGIYERLLAFEEAGATFDQAMRAIEAGMSVPDWQAQQDALAQSGAAWEAYQEQISGGTRDAVDEAALIAAGLPPEIASILAEGAPEVGEGADAIAAEIAAMLEQAKADAAAKAQGIIDALASTLATGPDQIRDEMQAIFDALANPYPEVTRRADLEANLAMGAISDALTSADPKIAADAFNQVQNWLEQYDLLEPGALERGELVNPAFTDGINSNLQSALDWYQTNVADEFASLSDIADQLDRNGYASLAAYARGVDRANRIEMYSAIATFRRDATDRSALDLSPQGYAAGASWVDGYTSTLSYAQQEFYRYASKLRGILPSSEPKDPSSPWRGITRIGRDAAMTVIDGWLATVPAGVGAISRWAGSMVSAMAMSGSMPGLTVPSLSPVAMEGAGGGSVASIVNQWIIQVEGEPKKAGSRDEILDLWEQLARFGGGTEG